MRLKWWYKCDPISLALRTLEIMGRLTRNPRLHFSLQKSMIRNGVTKGFHMLLVFVQYIKTVKFAFAKHMCPTTPISSKDTYFRQANRKEQSLDRGFKVNKKGSWFLLSKYNEPVSVCFTTCRSTIHTSRWAWNTMPRLGRSHSTSNKQNHKHEPGSSMCNNGPTA